MKKLFITLLALPMVSCLTVKECTLVRSSTGCCMYMIDPNDNTIVYVDDTCQRYEADGYHATIWYDDFRAREWTINDIEEHCYDNHFNK